MKNIVLDIQNVVYERFIIKIVPDINNEAIWLDLYDEIRVNITQNISVPIWAQDNLPPE